MKILLSTICVYFAKLEWIALKYVVCDETIKARRPKHNQPTVFQGKMNKVCSSRLVEVIF